LRCAIRAGASERRGSIGGRLFALFACHQLDLKKSKKKLDLQEQDHNLDQQVDPEEDTQFRSRRKNEF
jgi:hypothetical protein